MGTLENHSIILTRKLSNQKIGSMDLTFCNDQNELLMDDNLKEQKTEFVLEVSLVTREHENILLDVRFSKWWKLIKATTCGV